MTTRRRFLLATALGSIAPGIYGQAKRPVKIGMLSPRALAESNYAPGIVRRLGELGYRDGGAMVLQYRSADGFADRYPRLARELIGLKCDVIFTLGTEPAIPFRDAGYPVPVVFLAVDADPVERNLVASLRNPGVNATGVYSPQSALVGKRLEVLRELMPGLRRLLVFSDFVTRSQLPAIRKAAEHTGTQLTVVEFSKQPYDFEGAFAAGRKAQVQALITLSSPVFSTERRAISVLLAKYRLPSIGAATQLVEAGFLLSLNVDPAKLTRRAAELGVQILKGAKPTDIPVEQADEFELAINAKTAKALGVKIPESVLARATRIVE